LQESVQVWHQAVTTYQIQAQPLHQAQALTYLALAYFNLGQWHVARGTIDQALTLIASVTPANPPDSPTLLPFSESVSELQAQALNTQGNIQFALGQPEVAFATWEQAAIHYGAARDAMGRLGSELNQARALQTLGFYRRSRRRLEQTLQQLEHQPDPGTQAIGLRMLGVTLQALGDLDQAQSLLERSLVLSQGLQQQHPIWQDTTSTILVNLAQVLMGQDQPEQARVYYQQAIALSHNPLSRLEAQINLLDLQLAQIRTPETRTPETQTSQGLQDSSQLLAQIKRTFGDLPPSRATVYAQVHLANTLMDYGWGSVDPVGSAQGATARGNLAANSIAANSIAANSIAEWMRPCEIAQLLSPLLTDAIADARSLADRRSEAFALGQLGHLYEHLGQWSFAQELTLQALQVSQGLDAPNLMAQHQWQLGRVLQQLGESERAIEAYEQAIAALQDLRQDTVALDSEFKFSFTDQVEPIYRELVTLLLDSQPDQTRLAEARDLVEGLQLAELDNFFREACLEAQPRQIDQVDAQAAVIYPILLPDRLAVIVSLPNQTLFHYETRLPEAMVRQDLNQFLRYMSPHLFAEDRLDQSQKLYDWLIRPALVPLREQKIQRLVFVLGGSLRGLPVAALHDGQEYLIQAYGVAIAPGLQLLDPHPFQANQLEVLMAGLSQARQDFVPLPAVEFEIGQIASQIPSQVLLNSGFTLAQLRQQLQRSQAPILHLATHGQFSSRSEDTYLLAWDQRIGLQMFNSLLQERQQNLRYPIELLVLSACQTAIGDDRAALGLAGLAVRSGVRSTLATLWQVNDQSTAELMGHFYRTLAQNPQITKIEALRQAQLALVEQPESAHPFHWAPFILIGNWL
jgi:CHAT domain-containing protein/Tfp pilus assembly protein PilF